MIPCYLPRPWWLRRPCWPSPHRGKTVRESGPAEFLTFWFKNGSAPPLATTGPNNTLPVIGAAPSCSLETLLIARPSSAAALPSAG